jgi:hypothetical protein
MTKFDEIMKTLIAVVFLATCFGFIVWAGVLLMLWLQRLVLS